jgi:hypothetical protein
VTEPRRVPHIVDPIDRGAAARVRHDSKEEWMARSDNDGVSGWVGMAIFAGTLLLLVGGFNVIYGLVALFKDQVLVATKSGLVAFDVTTWGWITLLFGIFQICVGLAILAGQTWAIVVGVVLAVLNALEQLAFLQAQPVWSTIIIAVDVLIIYGLTAHGREIRSMH